MTDYVEELATERKMKDRFMAGHVESPFVTDRVPGFSGLRYFPIASRYLVTARLERLSTPQEAFLRTNRDGQAVVRYLGDLSFRLAGQALRLRLYHAGEGVGTSVFVPFRDVTSGRESYGPGRYVTLELNESDVYEIDFNRAFNPYCAYTDSYECAFAPAENDLPVPIRAGEKIWSADRNPTSPTDAVLSQRRRPVAARKPAATARRPTKKAPRPRKAARRKSTRR